MDLKKLDYITAPEEWIEDILEKPLKTSPSNAFWRKYGSIAAMIRFFLLCSTSVTVAAMKSTAFQTCQKCFFTMIRIQYMEQERMEIKKNIC